MSSFPVVALELVARFDRARKSLHELEQRSAPETVIALARYNINRLRAMVELLPTKRVA